MKKIYTDVDIDCFNREGILENLWHVNAGILRNGKMEKHPSGVYFQPIPRDPFTNISIIDHTKAGEYGYFKIDLLNVNMYEGVRDEEHLLELVNTEPNWDLLQDKNISDQLIHLRNYNHLLKKFKPKSIEDLAMILAIIRPAKSYLQKCSWEKVKEEVWTKVGDEAYQFKRSHALSYSLAIVVNLNLLIEQSI
jgi:hypothetical protein